MANKIDLIPIGKFIYRIPNNHINESSNLGEETTLIGFIRNILKHKDVKLAIYLSSPSLFREINNLLSEDSKLEISAKKLKSVCVSLFNYYMRMSMRATPFGKLSLTGSGSIESNNPEYLINILDDYKYEVIEFSGDILYEISRYLQDCPNVRKNMLYHINNTIFKYGNKFRYTDYTVKKGVKNYYTSEISATSVMHELIMFCKNTQSYSEICNFIMNKGYNKHDVDLFVQDLIKNNVVISELEPNLTHQTYHQQINNFIERNKDEIAPSLYSIFNDLAQTDISINSLEKIAKRIKELIPSTDDKSVFSTNSFISDGVKISNKIADTVQNGFNLFLSYCKAESAIESNLADWKRAFINKFGTSFVNIKEIFDNDGGVYYAKNIYTEGFDNNPFIDDIFTDVKSNNILRLKLDRLDKYIMGEAQRVYSGHCKVIRLSRSLLDFDIDANSYPSTLNAFCQIGIDNSDSSSIIINFLNSLSDSSTCMLGRLSPFHNGINSICSVIADWEQKKLHPGIVAEVNHPSNSEMVNIVGRNVKRKFTISILTKENSDNTEEISLDDLYIGIYEDRIVLFDIKNKKEVFPVISHAQNFNSELLPIFRFLADIQLNNCNQTMRGNRDVSYLLNLFNFQPRIVCENFIFSLAKWKVYCDELRRIFQQDMPIQISKIKEFFSNNSIPFSFAIVKGDQKLYLNLNNAPQIALITLESECVNKSYLIIEESFYSEYSSILQDADEKKYAGEYIFPFKNNANILNINSDSDNDCISRSIRTKIVRSFFPLQSEWLYIKLYAGLNTIDRIVLNNVDNIVSECYSKGLISIWHYVRYKDLIGSHLRLRFKIIDFSSQKCIKISQIINKHLSCYNKNEISSISYETFNREIERYDSQCIESIESLFCIDSDFQCKTLVNHIGNTERFFFGMRIIQSYLNIFFEDNNARKIDFVNKRLLSFQKEFPKSKATRIRINQKFHLYLKPFNVYCSETKSLFENFEDLIKKQINYLEIPHEIIPSIIHMSLVRLFKSRNRINEYVAFSFMERYYVRQSFVTEEKN